MRIKLFENFNDPGFMEIHDAVYNDKLKNRNKEYWTPEEIRRVEKISKKENYHVIFSKYSRIVDRDGGSDGLVLVDNRKVPFTCLQISIYPINHKNISPFIKVSSIIIDKIEDEWYLVSVLPFHTRSPFNFGYFECDQLTGLEEFLKMIFKK